MSKKRQNRVTNEGRQQKRKSFQAVSYRVSRNRKRNIIIGVLFLFAIVVFSILITSGTNSTSGTTERVQLASGGQDVHIPLIEVSGTEAKFYDYITAGNKKVSFFIVSGPDGTLRSAFDACDVCFHSRKGYRQVGSDMVCNNCGRHFPSAEIDEAHDGCNPGSLKRTIEGDQVVIKSSDLERGVSYF